MPVQRFNDIASGDGKVPTGGTIGGAMPREGLPSATGMPSGVLQTDGTQSPRANTQTFRSAGNTTPGAASAKFIPSTVDSFTDASV